MRTSLLISSFLVVGLAQAASIKLQSATFDPVQSLPRLTANLTTHPDQTAGLVIVQFETAVDASFRTKLEDAGLTVLDYLPDNAFLVRGLRAEAEKVPGVRWADFYHPGLRLSPEIGRRPFQDTDRLTERLQGLYRVAITLTRDADGEIGRFMIQSLGLEILDQELVGDQYVLIARGNIGQVQNAAQNEQVQFIEEAGEVNFRNNTSRWIVQTNVSGSTPLYTAGITGAGNIVGVLDSRISMAHTSFTDTVAIGPGHRKVVYYGTTQGASSHGTHVAGTVAGDAGVFDDRRGIAYGAKIAYTNTPPFTETDLYARLVTHHNQGARDHCNSWGDDGTTAYTGMSRAIDRFSWDFEDSLVVFAITNLTSQLKTPENAKSVMAVGATGDSPNQNNMAGGFSGPGPTIDGRRKPEVTAPGENILSSSSSNTTGTISLGGTSMACPAVTGSASLIRQFLLQGRIHDGNVNAAYSVTPSGALLRSMLITSGVDMSGEAGYPGNREGWGRILTDNVLALPGETKRSVIQDVRNAVGLQTGQSRTYNIRVINNTQPLRVTMAFTDFPAAVNTASAAVNDLNLTVNTPAGSTFRGNVFSGGTSVTGGTADAINSAEMVQINVPTPGIYTITVNAASVISGPQGFGLTANGVVSGGRVSGNLQLGDWSAPLPASTSVTFVNESGVPYAGGTVVTTITPGTGAFEVEVPPTVTGGFRLQFNVGAHLIKTVPSPSGAASTDRFANFGTVGLVNGDPDRSGEVDAVDIDLAIANFGATSVPPTSGDVDGSGEVDAADIDIIIANFGSVNG